MKILKNLKVKDIQKTKILELKKQIELSEKPLIITHYNPDGDAIGSVLAFYHYLVKKGKKPVIVSPNDYPDFLHWLPGNENVTVYKRNSGTVLNAIHEADLIFTLDFNDFERTEGLEKYLSESKAKKVLIDHHPNPKDFADISISEITYSSTAEMVYHVIESLGDEHLIDKNIAECIYCGIMTDTGSFNYNSSNPYTYSVVSKLLEQGIDKDRIYWNVYDNFSFDRMRLLGYCLHKKMEVIPEYYTAVISITKEELKEYNFVSGDTEGFVTIPLSIKNIRFTAIFIEKDKQIKISFRSKGNFSANKFAEEFFNGGGHKNASGGYSNLSLEETLSFFKKQLPKFKDELENAL